jgi:Lon protease-like protein
MDVRSMLEAGKPLEDRELKRLPILPLAGMALYPRTIVPYHVVEDRDGLLMTYCMMKRRGLGMPTLRPGGAVDAEGRPAVYEVMGAGRILTMQPTADRDGFVILVQGTERVRMKKELPLGSNGFREVRAERLATVVTDPDPVPALDETLRALLLRLGELDPSKRDILQRMVENTPDAESLVDLTGWSVVSADWRQRLLEELVLSTRIERATEAVGAMVLALTPIEGLPTG